MDASGKRLSDRVVRTPAFDAQADHHKPLDAAEVEPFYTLADQLFVEPQPLALPDVFDLGRPIRMSDAEVAVARSHIGIWRRIAQSDTAFALVLEDDVWFERGFGRLVDQAWDEMEATARTGPAFDLLYLSYKEVRHGAPKELLSAAVFRPERGLWYMSGYVLSKKGAQTLLRLLPCRGPVDLWINRKFGEMDVRALRRSMINQRLDIGSTNTYSVLPTLSRIGVLDGAGAAVFQGQPTLSPVFAFGPQGSGLSSLAMALSMLGYRCCSDLDRLPDCELEGLLLRRPDCHFDAYVNIASLTPHVRVLKQLYPNARFIVIVEADSSGRCADDMAEHLEGAAVLRVSTGNADSWNALCQHLRLPPPSAHYPTLLDMGQRRHRSAPVDASTGLPARRLRHDRLPWIVERRGGWRGISPITSGHQESSLTPRVRFQDDLVDVQAGRWLLRMDTFPGNLALFRPANVTPQSGGGLSLTVMEESLGVRNLSAGAVSSHDQFLYGRFEVTLQATSVPGVVTGFFLHRDSPRQEIDVEIAGNRPDSLLVNVFYNPGSAGAKFDYGYRGTPVRIPLGFDASKALHRYAIEWESCEIRWYADGELLHRRATWDPTPIPHLPMTLHVNTWPTRSRELAGRLACGALPASATVRRIAVDAFAEAALPLHDERMDLRTPERNGRRQA